MGSRPDATDDVVECLKMTHRRSGQTELSFKNGLMEVANVTSVNVSEVIEEKPPSAPKKAALKTSQDIHRSGIHLEPGK